MFDGLLKSKFQIKCKSSIKLTNTRIEMIKKKRSAMQKYLKNDIAYLLQNGLDSNAYARAEGFLGEMNLSSCYEYVELSCLCISNHLSAICKNRCYEAEQKLEERDRHPISNQRDTHMLYPVEINSVPVDTTNKDEILESEFFDTLKPFLSLYQGNHYQYDTLRRAKHSSMMVLYHLHNPTAPAFVTTCNICHLDIEAGQGWHCETCPDYDVCNACYQKDGGIDHPHKLTNHPSIADRDAQNTEARELRVLQNIDKIRNVSCPFLVIHVKNTLIFFVISISGTMLYSGGVSHTVPIYLAGRDLTDYLVKILTERGSSLFLTISSDNDNNTPTIGGPSS